jgi:tRNA(fMet)-specific endonuclease VapC
MSLFALDTDIWTLYKHGHAQVVQRISSHAADEVTMTVITVEELLSGWYAMIRQAKTNKQRVRAYDELANTVAFVGKLRILPLSEPALDRVEMLWKQKLGVRPMDLRIVAIALEHGATLVTRNLRDFQRVPNLSVENWAV